MDVTLIQSEKKQITYKFLHESDEVSSLYYRIDENDKHVYSFEFIGEDFEQFLHLLGLMSMQFVMYATNDTEHHLVSLSEKNVSEDNESGLLHEILPIVDGMIEHHYEIVVDGLISESKVNSRADLLKDEYFIRLTEADRKKVLSFYK